MRKEHGVGWAAAAPIRSGARVSSLSLVILDCGLITENYMDVFAKVSNMNFQ
jgi:hypothetical protein